MSCRSKATYELTSSLGSIKILFLGELQSLAFLLEEFFVERDLFAYCLQLGVIVAVIAFQKQFAMSQLCETLEFAPSGFPIGLAAGLGIVLSGHPPRRLAKRFRRVPRSVRRSRRAVPGRYVAFVDLFQPFFDQGKRDI